MQPGFVIAFAGPEANIPDGWLLCDGRQLSKEQYGNLFKAIGTAHGGNGSPTFNLPDYRGMFLRGVSAGSGRDPDACSRQPAAPGGNCGDLVGSLQGSAVASHSHSYTAAEIEAQGGKGCLGSAFGSNSSDQNPPWNDTYKVSAQPQPKGASGSETRPVNVYVTYIIKT